MNRKQRMKNRENSKVLIPKSICSNCGKLGSHFVPPIFGEAGFYACASFSESVSLKRQDLKHNDHKPD
jgi:hypothetical protein